MRARSGGQNYDIVLMDMQMPVMDGITATRTIRQWIPPHTLPVLAMTANAMQVDRDRCSAAGMQDFVSKPIDPEELWRGLAQWIRPRPGLGGAPSVVAAATAPATGSGVTLAEAVRDVQGLDLQLGLHRVLGKESLYVSMLRKFCSGQAQTCPQLRAALLQGDRGTAERMAHTLRGVAGNIGAMGLQDQAGAVESAIRLMAPPERLEALLAELQAALDPLLKALAAALEQLTSNTPVPAATDGPALDVLYERLQRLLDAADYRAADLFEEHRERFKLAGPAGYQRIDEAIRNYDFELASDELRKVMVTHTHVVMRPV